MKAQALAREEAFPVEGWTVYDMETSVLWAGIKPTAREARLWGEECCPRIQRASGEVRLPWAECYRAGLRVVKVELRAL